MNDWTPGSDSEAPVPVAPKVTKAWIVTFTDLISLMLTFFVMLFAMSTVQLDKWEEVLESLTRSDTPLDTTVRETPKSQYNISTTFRRRAMALEYLEAVLNEKMAADPVLRESRLYLHQDRLVLSLPGDLLFDQGRAALAEKAQAALFVLGGILRNIENRIAVVGHADPAPVTGTDYASNWELSLGRAVAVANALRRTGYQAEVTAYGYGAAHYRLLPKEFSGPTRDGLARRVDIFILSAQGG